jgi:hypothetical protein
MIGESLKTILNRFHAIKLTTLESAEHRFFVLSFLVDFIGFLNYYLF